MIESLEPRRLMSGDMVLHWNDVMIQMLRGHVDGPTVAARDMAVMDVAVYDAVNGIDGTYQPYLVHRRGPKGASEEAAAASAAFNTLRAMFPSQGRALRKDMNESILEMGGSPSVRRGAAWGRQVAAVVMQARRRDGSDRMVQYMPGSAPGEWQPDPLTPGQQAWGPGEGMVKPFVLKSGSQFRPPPPPALTSQAYADAFNQVKSLGAADSTMRTADETQIGLFWAYDVPKMGYPLAHYDEAVIAIAQQMHNTLLQNARLFGLVGIADADAGIAAWDTKYTYNFWRPITAIRRAAEDGNPNTIADPNWTPLGAPGDGVMSNFTPAFPSYISGHATFGGATFKVLKQFYGSDNIPFTLASDEMPGVTRSYTSFSQAALENGMSRVYLGIHWIFDTTFGIATGQKVADYTIANALQPRRSH